LEKKRDKAKKLKQYRLIEDVAILLRAFLTYLSVSKLRKFFFLMEKSILA